MTKLMLADTSMSQWQSLVAEAGEVARCPLAEDLESYLVFTLARYTGRPHSVSRVVALDLLEALQAHGRERHERLREIGDRCLLLSGLFPEQARRRRVSIGYFVDQGRCAYDELGILLQSGYAVLYRRLSGGFVHLMDVLHAIREMGGREIALEPVAEMDLWHQTGSRAALRRLRRHTGGIPMAPHRGAWH